MQLEEKKYYITLAALISPYVLYLAGQIYIKIEKRINQKKLIEFIRLWNDENLFNAAEFAKLFGRLHLDIKDYDKAIGYSTYVVDFDRILNIDNNVLWDLFVANKKPYSLKEDVKNYEGTVLRIDTCTNESDLAKYLQLIQAMKKDVDEHDDKKQSIQIQLNGLTNEFYDKQIILRKAEDKILYYDVKKIPSEDKRKLFKEIISDYAKIKIKESAADATEEERIKKLLETTPSKQIIDRRNSISGGLLNEKLACLKSKNLTNLEMIVDLKHLVLDCVVSYHNLKEIRNHVSEQYKFKFHEAKYRVEFAKACFVRLYNAEDKFPIPQ